MGEGKWLRYKDLIIFEEGKPVLKTRENLETEGYTCQWFNYRQLLEHLCMNNQHVIAKTYKLLLQMNQEDELVKECMVKWARNIGYNIKLNQWERMWSKGLKFTLSYNLKENFYKMMFRWYLTPNKLSKMFKKVSNLCRKCSKGVGSFYHLW